MFNCVLNCVPTSCRTLYPILCLNDCVKLNLVKLTSVGMTDSSHAILEEYQGVFTGLGCLQTNQTRNIRVPTRIPVSLIDRLKKELHRMEKIKSHCKSRQSKRVGELMITVEKPNSNLRTCLDPKELNAAMWRQHFQIPTTDEIMGKLARTTHFSTLDASCRYWQIPLTEDSTYLTTFNTPTGRYSYLRLSFGINSTQVFEDIEGVVTNIDDLLIYANDKDEHDRRLR